MARAAVPAPGLVRIALALIAVGVLTGCDGDGENQAAASPDGPSATQLEAVAAGLCKAESEATTDTQTARVTFFAESHPGLHSIAALLNDRDRHASAELLRAKQAVETSLSEALEPSAALNEALVRLHDATQAGLAVLDITVGPCRATRSGG